MQAGSPGRHALAPARGSLGRRALGRDWQIAWPFLTPLLVVLIGLIAYPFVSAIVLSMQRKMVGTPAEWVGLANYRELLLGAQYGPIFQHSVVISMIYTVVSILAKLVIGFCMALLLNEQFRGRAFMRGLLFLPWAMPSLIVALTWRWIYEGTPSGLLNLIRIDVFGAKTLVQWLANPDYALWSTIVGVVWQGTPFWCMMLLAGMQAIPDQLYEAAAIDGASAWQRFWHVTVPNLRSVLIVTTLLSTIWTANSINFIYILTRGGPAGATMTFPMLAFDVGVTGAGQMGMGAAISVLFFPLFIVAIYFLTRHMLSSEARA
ncbi:MAG TPA: sugar ABC transporter permease [Chloroflexota bacterium]